MAKNEKTAKAPAAANTESFKYGVSDVADALEVNEATARMKLRNAGIEKAGRSYGWDKQSDLKEVITKLKSGEKVEKPKPKVKAAGTETPARKAKPAPAPEAKVEAKPKAAVAKKKVKADA